ncbi:serine peptidase, family S28 [Pyronema omphalodes]|nr:serine peptidase, family S28 [Pyronema omphalodes]
MQLKTLAVVLGLAASVFARKHMREIEIEKELQILNKDHQFQTSKQWDNGTWDQSDGMLWDTEAQAFTPKVYWLNVSLPIDHDDPSVGNFSNRYWVVDEFYEPGGPIFTFDTGESNGGDAYLGYMTRNTTFFYKYLQEFKGLGIVWEHRYYGQSKPFEVTLDTPSSKMKYLTTKAALEDFVVFANQFYWKGYPVNPKKSPWVVIGGSYPGMRAAMLRHLYPETVYAAYASSAPVQAQKDMSIYFEQVYRGMVDNGLRNCTDHIKAAVDYIDTRLDNYNTSAEIKVQFLGRTADKGSNAGFADMLTYPFYGWQSGGIDNVIRDWCGYLNEKEPPKKATPEEIGKHYADRWASWPGFIGLVNEYNSFGYCEGPVKNETATPNCLVDERFTGDLGISWTWQYCTEWGYFQSTNLGKHALGSRYQSLQHQQEICYRQFPDGLWSGLLPAAPRTLETNAHTQGWYMRPSNVFWTGGQYDPWRTLSPLTTEAFAPPFRTIAQTPRCNQETKWNEVFGFLLKNSQHCYDFRASEQAAEATNMFKYALSQWLECFKPSYD